MKSIDPSDAMTADVGMRRAGPFGPVIAHRIDRIRARLDSGRYPLDVVTLADALVDYHDRERAVAAVARPSLPVRAAVAQRIAAAIRAMDGGTMLVLQLEFVEHLQGAEIALLFGADAAAISAVRRTALTELSAQLSAQLRPS